MTTYHRLTGLAGLMGKAVSDSGRNRASSALESAGLFGQVRGTAFLRNHQYPAVQHNCTNTNGVGGSIKGKTSSGALSAFCLRAPCSLPPVAGPGEEQGSALANGDHRSARESELTPGLNVPQALHLVSL